MKKKDQSNKRSGSRSNQGYLEMYQHLGPKLRARRLCHQQEFYQHSPRRNYHDRGRTMRGSRDRNRAGEEPGPRSCSNEHGEVISSEEIVPSSSLLLCLYSLS